MIKIFSQILFFLPLIHSFILAQDYKVESFQAEYIELENYTSLQVENLGLCCEKEYIFGFDFPYYDTTYTSIFAKKTLNYSFSDIVFAVRLLGFIYDWDIDITDPNDIPSDIRYANVEIDGMKALVIQYTKIRLASDPSIENFDSHLNFQHWFWEDGTIEIVFGDMNLDNSPNYIPNEGLFLIVNGDSLVNLGPEMGLVAPDESDVFGVNGPYDNLEEISVLGRLTKLAPSGWVIRFSRKTSSTNSIDTYDDVLVRPNPVSNHLNFVSTNDIGNSEIIISDISGAIVIKKNYFNEKGIDVSGLSSGTYFYHLIGKEGKQYNGKFIKQ